MSILYKYHISLAQSAVQTGQGVCRSFISIIFPVLRQPEDCTEYMWCRSFISIIFPITLEELIIISRLSVSILYKYHISLNIIIYPPVYLEKVSILYKYHISQKAYGTIAEKYCCVDPL